MSLLEIYSVYLRGNRRSAIIILLCIVGNVSDYLYNTVGSVLYFATVSVNKFTHFHPVVNG